MSGGRLQYRTIADGQRYSAALQRAGAKWSAEIAAINAKIEQQRKRGKGGKAEEKGEGAKTVVMTVAERLPWVASCWQDSNGGEKLVRIGASMYLDLRTGVVAAKKQGRLSVCRSSSSGSESFTFTTATQIVGVLLFIHASAESDRAAMYAVTGLSGVLRPLTGTDGESFRQVYGMCGSEMARILTLAQSLDANINAGMESNLWMASAMTGFLGRGTSVGEMLADVLLSAVPELAERSFDMHVANGSWNDLKRLPNSNVCGQCVQGAPASHCCTTCNTALCHKCASDHGNQTSTHDHRVATGTAELMVPTSTLCPGDQQRYGPVVADTSPLALLPLTLPHKTRGVELYREDRWEGLLWTLRVPKGKYRELFAAQINYLWSKLGLIADGPLGVPKKWGLIMFEGHPITPTLKGQGGHLGFRATRNMLLVEPELVGNDENALLFSLEHPGHPQPQNLSVVTGLGAPGPDPVRCQAISKTEESAAGTGTSTSTSRDKIGFV